MLSQTAEYAMRAVVHLARQNGPCTVENIAKATKIPISYLAKIMQQLSRAGMATSQRGLHGGFILSRPPSAITLYEVVDAVDPFRRILSCPMGIPEHGHGLCSLHRELDNMLGSLEASLRANTITAVLANGARPLCPAPLLPLTESA
jgi:Rrf2 family transcriptional regulator, nitric oxide-sensitive transcriptional repressor